MSIVLCKVLLCRVISTTSVHILGCNVYPVFKGHNLVRIPIRAQNIFLEDGGHILLVPGTPPSASSPHTSPLGTLERSASGHRWLVVGSSPSASAAHTELDHPRAGGLNPLQLFVGSDGSRGLSLETNSEAVAMHPAKQPDPPLIAAHNGLPSPDAEPWSNQLPGSAAGSPAASARPQPMTASPRGRAVGTGAPNSSTPRALGAGGGVSPPAGGRWWPDMAALRDGLSSLRFSPTAAGEAQRRGAQQYPETSDNVEMVRISQKVSMLESSYNSFVDDK